MASRGAIPEISWEPWKEISWEPWNYARGLRTPEPQYSLSSIIDGRHDAYIRSCALGLRAYGGPVLVRFAQQMNGSWYPWCEGVNGNRPGQFVQAWRHVHAIFAAEDVTNVKWVWSPVSRIAIPINLSQYPGGAYVDILGLSGYHGGSALEWTGWRSFASLFDSTLATLHRLAPQKPIQISGVSSAEKGGYKAAWIPAVVEDLGRHRQVTSVVWFDLRKQTDWRLNSSTRAGQAFAAGVASPRKGR